MALKFSLSTLTIWLQRESFKGEDVTIVELGLMLSALLNFGRTPVPDLDGEALAFVTAEDGGGGGLLAGVSLLMGDGKVSLEASFSF